MFIANITFRAPALQQFLTNLAPLDDDISSPLGIYADSTTIYSCLDRNSCRSDKVKMTDDVPNYIESGFKWGKMVC